MKLSTLLFASVLGATVFAAAGTASADRYVRGGYGYGYHNGYNRVVVRPAVRPWRWYGPRVVLEPSYVAPAYVEPAYIAPRVVVRAPLVVRPRYWHSPVVDRRW